MNPTEKWIEATLELAVDQRCRGFLVGRRKT